MSINGRTIEQRDARMCAKINIIVLFRSKNHQLDLGLLNIAQIIRDLKSGKDKLKGSRASYTTKYD